MEEVFRSVDAGPACMQVPYRYQQLESANLIRLLRILPGGYEYDTVCEIFHAILDERSISPKYTALSYVWGPSETQKSITCNGFNFTITENLESAIRALREVNEEIVLWIDQICINHKDSDERSVQVQIIKDIYSQAEETIACLGAAPFRFTKTEMDDDLEAAIRALPEVDEMGLDQAYMVEAHSPAAVAMSFAMTLIEILDGVANLKSQGHPEIMQWLAQGEPITEHLFNLMKNVIEETDPGWDALRHFFEATWFSRTWVIQEYILSLELIFQWGLEQIPRQVISELLKKITPYKTLCLMIFNEDPVTKGWKLVAWADALKKQASVGLLRLITVSSGHQATDLRDKMYAMLSLIKNSSSYGLIPDYNITTNGLFQKTTKALSKTKGWRF